MGVADDVACGAMLQALTAQYLAADSHNIRKGDCVLVHAAAGGVGRILVQLAKRRGATVIATAGGPEKSRSRRAPAPIMRSDYIATDFEPLVKEITSGQRR